MGLFSARPHTLTEAAMFVSKTREDSMPFVQESAVEVSFKSDGSG